MGRSSGDWTNLQGTLNVLEPTHRTLTKKTSMLSNWHRTWNPATDNRIPWFDKNYPEISGQRRQMPSKVAEAFHLSLQFHPWKSIPCPGQPSPLNNELWVRELFGPFFSRFVFLFPVLSIVLAICRNFGAGRCQCNGICSSFEFEPLIVHRTCNILVLFEAFGAGSCQVKGICGIVEFELSFSWNLQRFRAQTFHGTG